MNEEQIEELKSAMAIKPLVQEFMYSEEQEEFLVRISYDGTIIGILVVPDEDVEYLLGSGIADNVLLKSKFIENDALKHEEE